MAEHRSLVPGSASGGELANERVESDAAFQQLFDEPDVVQAIQNSLQRRAMPAWPGRRDTSEEPNGHRRDDGGFGELPGHSEQESGCLVARLIENVPLALQCGLDG